MKTFNNFLIGGLCILSLGCKDPQGIANTQQTKNELIVTLNSGEIYKFDIEDEPCIGWSRDAGEKLTICHQPYNSNESISDNMKRIMFGQGMTTTRDGSPQYEIHSCLTEKDSAAIQIHQQALSISK